MKIRKYKPSDRVQVEFIHYETGFLGKSMSKFTSNNKLWKKNAKYYLEKEPKSIFVLEDKNKVFGYIFGCLDDKNNNKIKSVVFTIFLNSIKSIFLPKKDRIYWKSQFSALIRMALGISKESDLNHPKNAGHIHINLLPEARGNKHGSKLLKEFEKYARSNNVKVIHAGSFQTKLNPNTNFWLRNGFKVYDRVKTSLYKKQ
ncbi:MAG: GNAT family N-acetyltransferase, partial [Nanoarchaeota archaeon]|nr:GNAT family N-acetyltransferase [Nanoarchaeota archaeon]